MSPLAQEEMMNELLLARIEARHMHVLAKRGTGVLQKTDIVPIIPARIDSVHQGDQDGLKGFYHINTVDCLTARTRGHLRAYQRGLPVAALHSLLEAFRFQVLGFHADNGSEYINHTVAKLLDKLRIELTKSRPRKSNDNALGRDQEPSGFHPLEIPSGYSSTDALGVNDAGQIVGLAWGSVRRLRSFGIRSAGEWI
jgi:hypothetical protein